MTTIIRLNENHLARVISLHRAVLADANPMLVTSETDAFFQQHMSACGQIFGIFDQDALVAYGILGLPRIGDPNFGTDHRLASDQLSTVAHIDGVAVSPDYRGQNWQYKLACHRLNHARKAGRKIALATVAPGNFASLINILSAGMIIRGLKEKYGGHRFLMRADLKDSQTPPPIDKITKWCPATDLKSCHELINAQYAGVTLRRSETNSIPEIGWMALHC